MKKGKINIIILVITIIIAYTNVIVYADNIDKEKSERAYDEYIKSGTVSIRFTDDTMVVYKDNISKNTFNVTILAKHNSDMVFDATDKCTIDSSDTDIAEISNGVITTKKEGSVTLTAKYGECVAKCVVDVKLVKLRDLLVSSNNIEIINGETCKLESIAEFTEVGRKIVTSGCKWESSNKNVAEVFVRENDKVEIVSKGRGKATITAYYGGLSATASVEVTKNDTTDVLPTTIPVGVNNTIVFKIGNPVFSINKVEREIDAGKNTTPLVIEQRTLIPIRAIIEGLGGTVLWSEQDEMIVINLADKNIKLWVNSKQAKVNEESATLDVAPQIINGRTMIPLRFIGESLGMKVYWEEETKKVTLTN